MICERTKCTGCQACYNICPKNAIKIKEDIEGFKCPEIDRELCINCDMCKRICPVNNEITNKRDVKIAYGAVNVNNAEVLTSSSGGIFIIIAQYFLKNNGYVSGCIFNKELEAIHIITNDIQEVTKMKKSKYVQSNIKNTYKEIKEKLEKEYKVLFSGTPCQVHGLKSYLGKKYENLYTIDIICHGVPSPKMLEEHKKWIEKKNGKLKNIDFRGKELRDNNIQILTYKFEKKTKKIKNYMLDPYYNAFYNALNYRECCYNCQYANCNRMGDITLGDYWGVEKYHPNLENKKGTSVILLNSEKGRFLFEEIIKNKVNYERTDIENVKLKNNNLNKPVKRPEVRDNIYNDMNEKGYKYIVDKYLTPKDYWIIKLKSLMSINTKQRIMKMIKRN